MPPPKRKHGRRPLAGDVEAVGVVVDGGVAVGGGGVDNHQRAGRHPHAAEFDILDSLAHGGENDRAVTHELVDGFGGQFGMRASRAHWSGWSHRTCTGGGQLVAGGVGTCHQQGFREHA